MIVDPRMIKRKMIDEGWNLKEFCEKSELTPPTLNRALTEKEVNVQTVSKLVAILNKDPEDLVIKW